MIDGVSKVQSLCNCFQFIVGDTQVTLGVSNAFVVKFMHDEGEINALHTGMVPPSFPQTMCSVISIETHILANRFYKFPGLATLDGFDVWAVLVRTGTGGVG